MSDTATAKEALVAPSEGQAQAASGQRMLGHAEGQPSEGQAVTESENVAKLHRNYAEKEKAFQREIKQRDQQVQQQTELIRNLQSRLNQMEESAAPDDFARVELRLKRAEEQAAQYAQAYQQAVQSQESERARQTALREVAEEFGVTVKDLEEATDYMSAVKLAVKAQQAKETRKQQDDEQRAADNMPDVGSGAPRTTLSEWERDWQKARESRDSQALMRLDRTRPKGAKT